MLHPDNQSLADQLGAQVIYHGQNAAGDHLFANGGPLVTHRFGTPERAVQRFGKRIKIDSPAGSPHHAEGLAACRAGDIPDCRLTHPQERREYMFGYLAGLLEK